VSRRSGLAAVHGGLDVIHVQILGGQDGAAAEVARQRQGGDHGSPRPAVLGGLRGLR